MVKNYKKGFTGDYGVKLSARKLVTLCTLEWPSFVVSWHSVRTLNVSIAQQYMELLLETLATLTNFHVLNNG